jgi:hypothetical protein
MLDLKGRRTSTGRAVAELLHKRAPARDILVCGRYWPLVDAVAELAFVRPVLSARNRAELAALRRRLRADPARAPYGVSVHASLLDEGVVSMLRDHVPVVMTWPIDEPAALDRVLGFGANGVITNEPEILREVRRRGGRPSTLPPATRP